MIKINIRPLPNARVPYDDAKDPALRQKVMLLNNNISSLSTQLTEAQKAVIELQKKPSGGGGGGGGGDVEYWARIAQQAARQSQEASSSASGHASTARTAKDGAVSAKEDAVAAKEAAVTAKGDAVTAKNDALSAKEAAVAAKEAAEAAARSVTGGSVQYTTVAQRVVISNDDSNQNCRFIPMELFASNPSKTYDVDVLFVYCGAAGTIAFDVYFLAGEYGVNRTSGSLSEVKYEIGVAPNGTVLFPGFSKRVSLENVSPLSDLSFVNGSMHPLTDASHKGSGLDVFDVYVKAKEHSAS